MYEIDEKDMQILAIMKQNSHLSIGKIAKKSGIPAATVHNRIKKLRGEGIIRNYTIAIDKAKLGLKMVAYLMVKAVRKADHEEILQKIGKYELVDEGAMITGEFDLIFKVHAKDIDDLNNLVTGQLRKLNEVAETRTYVAFKTLEK